jgi:putative hydrolase of the HAD superfamily
LTAFEAVVFDLDDTLYPEISYVHSGFKAVAQWIETKLEIPRADGFDELCRFFEWGFRSNTFNAWLEARGLHTHNLADEMVSVYRRHHPHIDPYPDTVEVLTRLHQQHRLGLLSDGYLSVQREKLRRLNLSRFFDAILFTEEYGRANWKPHPFGFCTILDRLGVRGNQAVYVADNPSKDFIGARRCALHTIRIRAKDGIYSASEPISAEYAADLEIDDIRYLEDAVHRVSVP